MTTFFERTKAEQELICKALDFAASSNEPNPYFDAIRVLKDGNEVVEAIKTYIEGEA